MRKPFVRFGEETDSDSSGPKGIASVEIAVQLLRVVEASPAPLTLKEIADAVAFSPSKAHHYLVSLVRSGLLERQGGGQRYALGSLSLQLGLTALARSGTANVVADAVRALREETGHACAFSVWTSRGPVVRHWEDSKEPMGISMRLGTVLPMIDSPTAAIFIAWLPDDELTPALKILPRGSLPMRHVVEIRQRTRKEGGAHASGTRSPTVAAVAAPIFGSGGRLAGALATLGIIGQFDDRPSSTVSLALRRHSRALSDALGRHA